MTFSLHNSTRSRIPRLPFEMIKDAVLGKSYALDLVFAGDTQTRRLNMQYRKRSYVPNVLSFPLDTKAGEIYINPNRVAIEAKRFNMNTTQFTGYLFIHGLLHLVGHDHGDTMEKVEARYMKRFGLS